MSFFFGNVLNVLLYLSWLENVMQMVVFYQSQQRHCSGPIHWQQRWWISTCAWQAPSLYTRPYSLLSTGSWTADNLVRFVLVTVLVSSYALHFSTIVQRCSVVFDVLLYCMSLLILVHVWPPGRFWMMMMMMIILIMYIFLLWDRITRIMYVDAVYCYRLSSVVCQSLTLVSPAKTAEQIETLFGLRTRVGPRNNVLDWGPDPPWEGSILRGRDGPFKVQGHCSHLYESSWTNRGAIWIMGLHWPKES